MLIAGKWLLRIMGLWNKQMKEMVEMNYLVSEPFFVDDQALRNLIPTLKKTSYDDGINETLKRMKAAKS